MDDSFSSIRNTRARPAQSADARVRQIDLRRRISVVRNAGTPRMPTSWGQPMSSRRAGQAQFARVVSLATRQQREPSFSSRLDAKCRGIPRIYTPGGCQFRSSTSHGASENGLDAQNAETFCCIRDFAFSQNLCIIQILECGSSSVG